MPTGEVYVKGERQKKIFRPCRVFPNFQLAALACLPLHSQCMSWKVLITARVFNTVGKAALQLLRDAGCEIIIASPSGPLPAAQLAPALAGIDAVLASPDRFSPTVLDSDPAKSLKMISRWGVGYDSIDIPAATRQGIVVAYTPGMLNETVADWTWALLLCIARRVHLGGQRR